MTRTALLVSVLAVLGGGAAEAQNITIANRAVTEPEAGAPLQITMTVKLSPAHAATITVDYAFVDGTARNGVDYSGSSGTVTFAPNQTLATLPVTILGDGVDEPGSSENFYVNLSNASSGTITDAQAVGQIHDREATNCAPTTFPRVLEGEPAVLTFQCKYPREQQTEISWSTLDGTAIAGSDYGARSGSFTFPPGDTSTRTVTVPTFAGSAIEFTEQFWFQMEINGHLTGSVVGILDDDHPRRRVAWSGVVGASASANNLTKTAGTDAWDAGAVSGESMDGDGYFEFTATENNTNRMAGLSHESAGVTPLEIDFAIYLRINGTFYVYENGVSKGFFGSYMPGDVFRVSVTGNAVRYYRNGARVYTSLVAPVFPLLVDASLFQSTATVGNAVIGAPEKVKFTNRVSVVVEGTTITKDGTAGWNAGATSTRAIGSAGTGSGYVQFTAPRIDKHIVMGLSHASTGVGFTDIQYGVKLRGDGKWQVVQNGVVRPNVGSYAPNDAFSITVSRGVVSYHQNGQFIYQSLNTPTYPLIVDSSFYSNGASLTKVVISGNNLTAPAE